MNMNRNNSGQRYRGNTQGQKNVVHKQEKAIRPLNRENYADLAEEAIRRLAYTDRNGNIKIDLTTNKIRNLLSLSNTLYAKAVREKSDSLGMDFVSDIQYLKIRFAYEAGRENKVRSFVNETHIIEYIDNIGNSKENLLLFCRYMEALVAYHKFYGGRD